MQTRIGSRAVSIYVAEGGVTFAIGNQFNFCALKKNSHDEQDPECRINAVQFLFALPLLVVLLLAFRNVIADNGSDGQTKRS